MTVGDSAHEHRLVSRVLAAADEYRVGSCTAEYLQSVVAGAMSAVEGDLPKPVRDAPYETEARIETVRFTTAIADQPREIGTILDHLESVIDRADAGR